MSSLPLPRELLESERDVLLVGMSGVGNFDRSKDLL